MDRKEFLSTIGFGAAFALTATCLNACKKAATTPTNPVDFTIDLNATANAALSTVGGYVIQNAVVIARTAAGYAAATVICSHEGRTQIYYNKTNNEWNCSAHGARFSIAGVGLNGNGSGGLTIYQTTLTGTNLRIHS